MYKYARVGLGKVLSMRWDRNLIIYGTVSPKMNRWYWSETKVHRLFQQVSLELMIQVSHMKCIIYVIILKYEISNCLSISLKCGLYILHILDVKNENGGKWNATSRSFLSGKENSAQRAKRIDAVEGDGTIVKYSVLEGWYPETASKIAKSSMTKWQICDCINLCRHAHVHFWISLRKR